MTKKNIKEMKNPKGEDMCNFEAQYYPKCNECPRTLADQLFCKTNSINTNLAKIIKILENIKNNK